MPTIRTAILFIGCFCGLVHSRAALSDTLGYTLIYTKGDVILISAGHRAHSYATFIGGYTISHTDTLVVTQNSEAELKAPNGRAFVINQEGSWAYVQLSSMEKNEKNGILSGLYEMITDKEDAYADKFMREICGVSRGQQCPARFYPLFGQKVSSDTLVFKWDNCGTGHHYEFSISSDTASLADTIVFFATTDSAISVRLSDYPSLQKGKKYFWKLNDLSYIHEIRFPFILLSHDTIAEYMYRADRAAKGGKHDEKTHELIKASYLESSGLFDESRKVYEALITKFPSDSNLKEVFKMFKLRVGYE